MPKILVTDASERASLAVIRSLGRHNMEVIAAECNKLNCGFLTKYASDRFVYPSPQFEKEKFVDTLLRLVRNQHFDVLIPVTEFTLIPILERKSEFDDYVRVASPTYETFMKTFDKAKTVEIAGKLHIPAPETFLIYDLAELQEISCLVRYPVVIKPRSKSFWIGNQAIMLKVTDDNYAFNKKDLLLKFQKLLRRYEQFGVPASFFMVQEYASGNGFGVELLMSHSKVKAFFIHERLREYPITGGASTLRVSIQNKTLLKYAVQLLDAMEWNGVAMVEFKFDVISKEVNLIEVNGRFWGSLALSINSGVDFPYLLYKSSMEETFDVPRYNVGVHQRWLVPGDLLWFYSSLTGHSNTLVNLKKFIEAFSIPDDIFCFKDANPAIGALRTSVSSFMDVFRGVSNIYGESTNPRRR